MAISNNKKLISYLKKTYFLYFLILLASYCGVKGPPLQPVLKLIPPVENAKFYQKGKFLFVEISLPVSYSDGTSLEIKKVRVHYNFYPPRKRVDLNRFLKEAISEEKKLTDERSFILKREIKIFPQDFKMLIFYWDSRGKKSQTSRLFEFEVKEPPEPPENLKGGVDENGIHLKWRVERDRKDLGFFLYFFDGKEFKRVNSEPLLKNDFVFKDFTWDKEYRFKVNSVSEKFYESDDSEEISVIPVDKFPPPPPKNLVAIPEEGFILLKWEKVEVNDLEKYNVYRELNGERELLTLNGAKETKFEDRTGEKGKIYKYFVTAVDIKGNESNPSNLVEERYR